MGAPVPWGQPVGASAPAPAPAQEPSSINAGTLLLIGIIGSGIAMWIGGKYRAKEEEERAEAHHRELENVAYDLEGAREDQQNALAIAFARRPVVPWGHQP